MSIKRRREYVPASADMPARENGSALAQEELLTRGKTPPWRSFASVKPREDGRVWLCHGGEVYLGRWDNQQAGFYFTRYDSPFFTRTLVSHWMTAEVPLPPMGAPR